MCLRGSHSFTCHPHTNHTCIYSPLFPVPDMTYNVFGGTLNFALSIYLSTLHPQSITALWLVHIAPTHEGMARLS